MRSRLGLLRLRVRAVWVMLTGMGAAASVAFGLLVFVSVLASLAIPRESAGLRTAALQRMIAASYPVDRTVIGTGSAASMMNGVNTFPAADLAAAAPPCGRGWPPTGCHRQQSACRISRPPATCR